MKFIIFLVFLVSIGSISLNAYGESIDEMYNEAEKLMMKQNYAAAIEKYSKILDIELEDEVAQMNRAYAFSMIGNYEESLEDFTTVLNNNPENLVALEGKAVVLSRFDCESYDNCRPLEALHLFETALTINPNDEQLKIKRDFILTLIPAFDIPETNGDYFANIQYVTRDKDNKLVSVIECVHNTILPIKLLEEYMDAKENDSIMFKKEIVKIGQDEYVKWYTEDRISESEEKRQFFGTTSFSKTINTESHEGDDVKFILQLLHCILPAQNVDVGDKSLRIVEFFKKI